jgi:hypothetical protein
MKFVPTRIVFLIVAMLIFAASAPAVTITGTVHNGTTNSMAPHVDVILLSLQNGMDAVANTKTDAQGRFKIDYTPSGQMPMLIRVNYKGVNFHAMLPPGQNSADVNIYEPDANPSGVQFTTRLVVFQPNGTTLLVGEEYEVENQSKPPRAFYKVDGDFDFQIPEGAQLGDVSAAGPERMPVTQSTISRGPNQYAIAYAFRPGVSGVRISYQLPYTANSATVHLPSQYSMERVVLLAPPAVQVSAPGFQPSGSEQGMSVYSRDSVTAGTNIDVSLSGTGPAPSANGDQGQEQAAPVNGRDSGAPVAAVPPRLDTLKWVLLGGFASMFLLGGFYLWKRPAGAVAAGGSGFGGEPAPIGASGRRAARQPAAAVPMSAEAAPAAIPAVSATLAAVDREAGVSLDELKDTIFRLELRHQAGTISKQEYAEQRARAEKVIRDLLRG